ncbi:hypothetical protein Zmor_023083 [Zophobas morio]|uniref:Uncharacterized protein n=1 Tax=Zophobas morio TaxID=2755281 RepID=A0AA38HY70_9CUCU|nr:hypothetical protein Zmor_023083 [Zophobas morio]
MFVLSLFVFLILEIILSVPVETSSHSICRNNKMPKEEVPNYYWREYNGQIPADAIIGGQDINGDNVYIGQAYVSKWGLFTGQIKPGLTEVFITNHGITKVDKYIKILCGFPQESFVWLPTNATSLHMTLLDKHVIIGGHQDGSGIMNVGRINYEGSTQIISYMVGNADFHWPNVAGYDIAVKDYEVLVYEKPKIE